MSFEEALGAEVTRQEAEQEILRHDQNPEEFFHEVGAARCTWARKFFTGSVTSTLPSTRTPIKEKSTMALFKVKTSKPVETQLRLEESTVEMLNKYAHFHQASADDVANQAMEYIFTHDKDFQQHLQQNPDGKAPSSVRVRKPVGGSKPKNSTGTKVS